MELLWLRWMKSPDWAKCSGYILWYNKLYPLLHKTTSELYFIVSSVRNQNGLDNCWLYVLLKKVLSIQLADSVVWKGQDNFTLMSGSLSGLAGRLGSPGFSIRAFTSSLSRMTISGESEFLPGGSGLPEKVFLGTGCGNRSPKPGPRNWLSVSSLIFCIHYHHFCFKGWGIRIHCSMRRVTKYTWSPFSCITPRLTDQGNPGDTWASFYDDNYYEHWRTSL